jgi:hydrogenase maturation protease
MSQHRILVAGIGNIFFGDDAFGVEVVRRLADRPMVDDVRVADFGIRGFDLAFALLDDIDLAILVDAAPRGDAPGTVYVIEPDFDGIDVSAAPEDAVEPHGMNPMRVLHLVKSMGGRPGRVLVVGCEPARLFQEAESSDIIRLSPPVAAAVDLAVETIESLIGESRVYPQAA